MYETLELERPWHHVNAKFSRAIITAVLGGSRPTLSSSSSLRKDFIATMMKCWAQTPALRPTAGVVRTQLSSFQLIKGTDAATKDGTVAECFNAISNQML